MKRIIIIILCLLAFIPQHDAQTKSQVISDITYAMDDFASDLSFVNENQAYAVENIQSISHTFGSADYFLYNNQQMKSFQSWLEDYCFKGLGREYVEHSFRIIQQTFEKVDPDEEQDKRYRFDAIMKRTSEASFNDEKTLSFVIEWKGKGQYVSILEVNGELYQLQSEAPKAIHANATLNRDKTITEEPSFEWSQGWTLLIIAILIVIVWMLWAFFAGSSSICHLTCLTSLVIVGLIYFNPFSSMPDQLDEKIVASYDRYFKVDSLKVAAVCKDGKWGLIDYNGEVLAKPHLDSIFPFHNGLARNYWSYRYGYMDSKGKTVIFNRYEEATDFRDGKALVMDENIYYIIGAKGDTLTKLPYSKVHPFKNGYAKVELNKKVGYIRESDFEENIPTTYEWLGGMINGYAIAKNSARGMIDSLNNVIIPFKYKYLIQNEDNYVAGTLVNANKWGVLNKQGEIIIPYKYEMIRLFSKDLFRFQKGKKWGIANLQDDWVLNPEYDYIHDFYQEDLAMINKGKKYGLIDKAGNIVVPIKYDRVYYQDSLIAARLGKWGAVDKQGRTIIPHIYDDMSFPNNDRIPVKKQGKWGYINYKNELVIPYQFDYCSMFSNYYSQPYTASVRINKLEGVIDLQGNFIIPCEYQSLSWVNGVYIAKKDNKYGVLDKNGKVKHDFQYKDIMKGEGSRIWGTTDGKTYHNLKR